MIAGELPNTPANLTRWIQHPRQVEPRTAMPDLGVNATDAYDIAAYLYTLRQQEGPSWTD
jgi:cytochrome c2